ncbi:MAG: hypothetical protein JF616_00935 [Fibrobacteres bacterium]|jgi:hypothetical protein|nr:hypothetical protein [Fibrobacterota bacterium]
MKDSVVRDLIANNLARLVNGGLQGVYSDPFAARLAKGEAVYPVQAPVVLSQLAMSPLSQILSFLTMETDSMVRVGKRILPDKPKEEALKLVVSANAEILNFVTSRLAWLLSKLENSRETEISPPRVGNFSGVASATGFPAFRIRAEEGVCYDFECAPQRLAFRFACCVQTIA